jgi:hypothetical protein
MSEPSGASVAEQDAFAFVAEAADLAREHADALADAAMRRDRARTRLRACLLSRAVHSALLTVTEILIEAERNRP